MKSSDYKQDYKMNIDQEPSEKLFTITCTKIDNFHEI